MTASGGYRSLTIRLPSDAAPDPLTFATATAFGPGAPGPGAARDLATGAGRFHLVSTPSVTIAGRGAAATLPAGLGSCRRSAPAIWLDGVESAGGADCPVSAPLAVGALPFAGAAEAELTVPWRTLVLTDGGAWLTAVAGPDSPLPRPDELAAEIGGAEPASSPTAPCRPGRPALQPVTPEAQYLDSVRQALDAIAAGTVTKVVLARAVQARFAHPVPVAAVVRRLRQLQPTCTVFAAGDVTTAFVGASPELLVERHGELVVSHPLAGTTALVGDAAVDDVATRALLASAKDAAEHRWVVDQIASVLLAAGVDLQVPPGPSVLALHGVAHLGTRLQGRLHAPRDALALALALHPTPAVAGTPTAAALRLLGRLERFDRGPYAGPVGWVEAGGDGAFVVGIRSAVLRGGEATVFGGAGIVAGSDPEAELHETSVKLRTVLDALGGDPG